MIFKVVGITYRQNSSGRRTKKYVSKDSPKYNDLNARGVIKTKQKEYKALYARIFILRDN